MLISSPMRTRCHACRGIVEKGARILFDRSQHRIYHALCTEEGRATAESVAESHALTTDTVYLAPDGLAYLPFQNAGIAFAIKRAGIINGDEMGLGKTVQTVGVLNNSNWRTVCIVCPKSLVTNWLVEIKKWRIRPWSIQIVDAETSIYDFPITIVNYEQLSRVSDRSYDILVIDEAHYVKSPDSKRTQYIEHMASRSKKRMALTGTPIPSRPLEIWPLLKIVAPDQWDKNGKGYKRFVRRYCDARVKVIGKAIVDGKTVLRKAYDVKGASNLPELQERLRGSIMLRRLKSEVLKELPPKRRRIVLLPAETTKDGECIDLIDLPDDLEACIDRMTENPVAFEAFSKTRKEQALRKVTFVIEHVKRVLASIVGKVLLFAHHSEVIDLLVEGLKEFEPLLVKGETEQTDRDEAVRRFQTEDKYRLFIGSLGAAGVGLTLTAANYEVFAESSFVPGVQTQAEDRAHRIGQRDCLNIDVIAQDGSIDAHVMRLVFEKQEILDLALDRDTLA